jgi:hypothetical protein
MRVLRLAGIVHIPPSGAFHTTLFADFVSTGCQSWDRFMVLEKVICWAPEAVFSIYTWCVLAEV